LDFTRPALSRTSATVNPLFHLGNGALDIENDG
jgi:hypothetical protein